MNGVVEIKHGEHEYRLMFNVQASMVFQNLYLKSKVLYGTEMGQIQFIGDLFYSGLCGEAFRTRSELPTYEDAMQIFDDLSGDQEFSAICGRILTTYTESKTGSQIVALGNEILKKKAEGETKP